MPIVYFVFHVLNKEKRAFEKIRLWMMCVSSEEGIRVSIGFFNSILIPSFWMLRPSHFDPKLKLWVWTPEYDCVEGIMVMLKI